MDLKHQLTPIFHGLEYVGIKDCWKQAMKHLDGETCSRALVLTSRPPENNNLNA